MSTPVETFAVYISGDSLPGTDIGFTYVEVTTPLGRLRMTAEEAADLGRKLLGAAEYDRESEAAEEGDR